MRVIVPPGLPEAALARLAGHSVEPASGRDAIARAIGDAAGLVALLTDRIDEALLAQAPALRVVANVAVGTDNIDRAAAARRGIAVCNTPGVLTDATADLAFGLLIAAARRFAEGADLVRAGRWTGWEPGQLAGRDVAGATVGLVGFGRIGRAVAARARGFSMKVLYAAPRPAPPEVERALSARRVSLDELCAQSDFVSLHCPLTDATRHLIGAPELARMKPTAILINTARGPIVDEEALAARLAAGGLFGCALDVHEHEPRVHPLLAGHPRALCLPHVGSATDATRAKMAELACAGASAVLRGERPDNLVDPPPLDL